MAYISTQRGVRGRRPNLFAALASALGVWRQRRHLSGLDAHLRRDLGLSESDILREIDRPVWDVPQVWRY